MRREQEKEREEAIAKGEVNPQDLEDLPLPAISWVRLRLLLIVFPVIDYPILQYKCRQIMTRADFMEGSSTSLFTDQLPTLSHRP